MEKLTKRQEKDSYRMMTDNWIFKTMVIMGALALLATDVIIIYVYVIKIIPTNNLVGIIGIGFIIIFYFLFQLWIFLYHNDI